MNSTNPDLGQDLYGKSSQIIAVIVNMATSETVSCIARSKRDSELSRRHVGGCLVMFCTFFTILLPLRTRKKRIIESSVL